LSVQAVELLYTPYKSAIPLIGTARPKHLSEYDYWRISSYQVYEQIYWNVQDTFKLEARGTSALPIYIPTGREIVDTTARFVGKGLAWVAELGLGQQVEADNLGLAINALFRRERMVSKFNSSKLYGLMHGDWCFHLMADVTKLPGSRLRIINIDPGSYFPVTHPDDPDRIIAVHLIELVVEGDKTYVKRQTYTKGQDPINNDGTDTSIWSGLAVYDLESWFAVDASAVRTITPPFALPPQITAIPVYHIKNQEQPGNPYGNSEMRGFERMMAGVNQSISDEELALALDGLGVYATDASPPVDAQTGLPVNWRLGPGKVVEHGDGKKFDRINGIGSVTPVQDHLSFLIEHLRTGSGTPDAAIGKVDVKVAESGVSLALQLSPMIAKVDFNNQTISDVLTQFFYDLRAWFSAYEALQFPNATMLPTFLDAMPVNHDAKVKEIMAIVAAGIASAEWGRIELAKLGYIFAPNEGELVMNEKTATATAADPFAATAAAVVNAPSVSTPAGGA
jgi:hypothetical protein